jgi:small GTP-binding protein
MEGLAGSSDPKVILMGEMAVGKTSIIQQYGSRVFDSEIEVTLGTSFMVKQVETPLGATQIHIWDTAGQERYRSVIPMYIRNAAAAILVVDITNQYSFDKVDIWLNMAEEHCGKGCAIYVVANKIDLEPAMQIDDIRNWATNHTFPFFKTSAKDYESVARLFERVAEDLIKSRTARTPPAGGLTATPEKRGGGGGCC